MRTLTRVGVAVAASSAALLLTPVAHAADGTTTIHLRQELPLTATSKGVENGECPGIADDMDGWHFVLPGHDGEFVKLTVTFSPGGTQEITDFSGFGNPEGKHAYVASAPGAELTGAVAEIKGSVPQDLFNLSHTCPADEEKPTGSPTPTDDTSATPTGDTSATPTAGTSASPSASAGDTSSPAASGSATAAPAASSSGQGGGGDLAETGNGAPVGLLSGVAAVLVAGGGFLVLRRRRGQHS